MINSFVSNRNNNPEDSSKMSNKKAYKSQNKFSDEEMKRMI